MTRDEQVLIEVLTEAAIEMPWPEDSIEEWLVRYARRAVEGHVSVSMLPAPPPDVSLMFGTSTYLVARRSLLDTPFSDLDRRLLAALTTMATASRHAARREARLQLAAHADDLTGLWHHAYFRELLETVAETRLGETLAVLFLDVDGMKRLNEHLGHLDADEVLREVGSRLRSDVFPEGSFAARMGGDEFAVVVRHLEDAGHLDRIVAGLHETLREPVTVNDNMVSIEVSIGQSLSVSGADDPDDLLREAERRMRQAKRSRSPDALPPRWYDDRTVLRDMLEQGRVEVAYQPIVDLRVGEALGYEALVRGRHLEFGPVSPMMLVGAATKLQMLDELTEVVLEASMGVMGSAAAQLGREVALSVNIEFEQLRADSRLLRSLPDRVRGSGVHLILEMSERHVARWSPAQRAMAAELADAGVGLAVDDFGTGFSAISLLTGWDWEWVKVDRALVADAGTEGGRTVLGHVAHMLADLDRTAVAEGVENPAELEAVRESGLVLAQGTYFAPPAPAESVLAHLAAKGPTYLPEG
ncbi:bifunctional diguanylate cyclase/phosphodiesterase [Nocardioides sp.]|uniref:bifunctional diguanylate cyclase/phosphodiesterase n=1 Tax=Nocardioides sp. TaxID=35761 RepID=UPI00272615A9|nr:bifunctional diguanylate cyclase/phosphodiesterase [Nocardioides sp.]MDO9456186.1 bifunctional diguanylate cyclase/phosphodiesterase [Nocardioides sp.]